MDIDQFITLLRNNIFQWNLVIALTLLWTKGTKFYSDSYVCDIFIVQCLGVCFFTGYSMQAKIAQDMHQFHKVFWVYRPVELKNG